MLIDLILAAQMALQPCPQSAGLLKSLAEAMQRRPSDATLHYWRAAAWARCGQPDPAVAALDKARELGDGFLPIEPIGFAAIWNDAEFKKRFASFERALPQAGLDAPVVFRARGAGLIPEGVAYDATKGALFLGSIAQRTIVRVAADGQRVFASPDAQLDAVLGLAIDAKARRLYAVSTNQIFPRKDEAPRNEVVVFDLDNGAVLRRLAAANGGQLNDVAIARDGTVYVTDSRAGGVFVAKPDAAEFTAFAGAGTVPGCNGIAVADEQTLFVAHATGVARIDRSSGAVSSIVNTTRETIAAIDGLYLHKSALIGVQNATHPGRVIRITLDADAARAIKVETLLSHHHRELAEPTTGAVDGDRFLLLANSYVGALDDDGKLRKEAQPHDPVILEVSL